MVGGYAVSGLGQHRFSVDCDIVISKGSFEDIKMVLDKQGFEFDMEKRGFDETYAGEFARYKKRVAELPVTFDLLVGSLMCRSTSASWSFEYIKNYSVESSIEGIESAVKSIIPEKELMVAFKIHSGRRTDVRDIVMLVENSDMEKILLHLRRGDIEVLKKQFSYIIGMLNDEKLVDSLKGVFNLTRDVEKQIADTRKIVQKLSKNFS